MASHGCNTHTQREAGPSRTVRARQVRVSSLFGDDAVTPRQAARCRRGSQRWLANSDHRGTCGANLKHRARDFGEKADLRFRHYPDGGLGRDRRSARYREISKPVGPLDPRRPAPPRTFSEGASAEMTRAQSRRGNDGDLPEPRCPQYIITGCELGDTRTACGCLHYRQCQRCRKTSTKRCDAAPRQTVVVFASLR